ncbi:MAG: Chaperone SurA [Flavobacteriaceae bacterium]|jgi:peptidyl-prolyl cis-trans isomerase SurA|nr:peptidylprolyl isomerase [Flavobacteriaceae bacterium]CAI8225918.1 MAG: Chaperone SurA [Flavobacteriaceae bacterium]
MPYVKEILKYSAKFFLLALIAFSFTTYAQSTRRVKIDGVTAVVGDYVILDSDIEKLKVDIENQGAAAGEISDCQLLGKLMEDRLYAHQAVQDSLLVSDTEVNATSDRQIQQLASQIGSVEKVLEFYNQPDLQSFKDELYDINKLRMLAEKMKMEIVGEVEVTPEEVRQFFYEIPITKRPVFGAELEIAQIVKQPKPSEEEKRRVIQRLEQIRQDVIENGSSFSVKAILYSQDPGSKSSGGAYSMTRETPFVKEFKDVAFSLREGEISEPFETDFGYHIILVEKIRGQEVDLRHILIIPEISNEQITAAQNQLDSIRNEILADRLSFEDAALQFSDETETKYDGGILRNPQDYSARFELTNMDPTLYNQVARLRDNEISKPIREDDPRGGAPKFKIMKIANRYDEHMADFARDYTKIKELALADKERKLIEKWISEKIEQTYVQINDSRKDCDFTSNWLKK